MQRLPLEAHPTRRVDGRVLLITERDRASMSEMDRAGQSDGKLTIAEVHTEEAESVSEGAGKDRSQVFESGRQPLRPDSSLRPVRKPQQPIAKPASPSGLHKAMGVIRATLPVVQKVLPLLEGNVGLAVANLLLPSMQQRPVDLKPVEDMLSKMRTDHQDLRGKIQEQSTAVKRIGEQLELVKEAGERHSLGQKELTDDLYRLRTRVTRLVWIGMGLLVISIGVNVFLLLRVSHIGQ